ncbi:MAG: ribonuclease PH [Candidatus Sumerlaeia bacterium]|nr:ribonuclease PH [Candidatus Sumerlaeia bacterium]
MANRVDGRKLDELRKVVITPNPLRFAEGSAMIEWGNNKVLCAATLEQKVPPYLIGTGSGWVTAEYAMLPRSAKQRVPRESAKGAPNKRGIEISRIVSRALRAAVDLKKLGERTILLDCDVIESDGGTRTASITGAWVAMALAVRRLEEMGQASQGILAHQIAAVSVGVVEGRAALDLNYIEDAQAETDMNIVMNELDEFVELQGTAEKRCFNRTQLEQMLAMGQAGIAALFAEQKRALG